MLKSGDPVPQFRLRAGTGETVDSGELRGRRWVLYFYPKDHTSGCTIETREFGVALPEFRRLGVPVYGCSEGGVESKADFAAACGAPDLPLLSDPDHGVAEAFGAWRERVKAGDRFMQTARVTFLVDAAGRVERIWDNVTPEGHARDVLDALAGSGASG